MGSHSYVKHLDFSYCSFSQSRSDFGFKIMCLSVVAITEIFGAMVSIAAGSLVKQTQLYYWTLL